MDTRGRTPPISRSCSGAFIRSHRAYQALPVVVLTTRGDDDSRDAALKAGATRYLTKPFSPDALAAQARLLLDAGAEVEADRR